MKRFSLRLEQELHEQLRLESFKSGRSINEIIVELIEEKYKGENNMLKLIEKNHGEEKILIEGTLEEIVRYLKENENITNWVLDEDPQMELPDLDKIEDLKDLEYELKKIDLSWWTLEVEGRRVI